MALPTTFGTLTSTSGSLALLDGNFNALGALVTVIGTVTGTNAIAFTQSTNNPAIASYANYMRFGFVAANTSTGTVTFKVNSLAALNLYGPDAATQITTGGIVANVFYEVVYNSSLNSGAGGFQVVSNQPPSTGGGVSQATATGLKVTNAGTPNTQVSITATSTTMVNSSGVVVYVVSPSVTIDLTTGTGTSTANGMDGEARGTNNWIYLYLISNGSATAGLGTLKSPLVGGPTLPSGYTYKYYAGAMYVDGSGNLMRSNQLGRYAQYIVTPSTNTANLPLPSLSSVTTSFTAVSLAAFVPPTAGLIRGVLVHAANTSGYIALAPNANYGAYNSVSNPPPVTAVSTSSTYPASSQSFSILLESGSVYVASNDTPTLASLGIVGWDDYCALA